MAMTNRHAGLMSGTSLDGVDTVLADFGGDSPRVIASCHLPFPVQMRQAALSLQQAGHNELHRAALLGNQLAAVYAEATRRVVEQAGTASDQISAIGAKGSRILGTIYSA
ncbi:Anhydro-N-acetylmuramic acid kinase [Georgfuchsia toluolica]|uniref:Anhydro-N-acetylmuramic acid kinase n=1 Tax=Georgfuchsia toluolica TaxID=424218 RepID=A0A916J5H5_9PROT|nr:anhydro-N-acetylmuramic acid kinase [Georgfuchsia toluolica]CAG4884300.1 Anhydro-N-acetylmuramic acid kinase [Georgfuchsia toluolica]